MKRTAIKLVLLMSLVCTGCTMDRRERAVNWFDGSGQPRLDPAPFKGDYSLYRSVKNQPETVVFRTRLEPPAKIGFSQSADGQSVAIAGNDSIPMEAGRYGWRGRPDEGQYDSEKTGTSVGTAALVIISVAVGIALLLAL